MKNAKEDNTHIRRLKEQSDLLQVADLMEICFGEQLDRDGREYIRQMRRAASDARNMRWIPGASEMICMPMSGFVWEEEMKIIGNLTLIPYKRGKKWIYLIANVAVHPDFRQQGIAKQLTQRALDHLKDHGVSATWLQVRDDNAVAQHIYRKLGFVDKARRTVWQLGETSNTASIDVKDLDMRERAREDWEQQRKWLSDIYPSEIAWYLSFDMRRLDSLPMHNFVRWLNGTPVRHWSAYQGDELVGVLSWEPGRTYTDLLWLAVSEEWEMKVIREVLPFARKDLSTRKPLSINFPAGRGKESFLAAGFEPLNTLIWMSVDH